MKTFYRRAMKTRVGRAVLLLRQHYVGHDVAHQAAALAYYLLFSLFPILILVSSLIGRLNLDLSGILSTLTPILPRDVLALIESYLGYAAAHTGRSMLYFSAVFSIWFPMRSTNCLMHAVRRAYDLDAPEFPLLYRLKVLLYTVLLLISLTLSLILATLSRTAVAALSTVLGLPEGFSRLWGLLRFLLLGLIIFAALGALYTAAQDRRISFFEVFPGALLSTLAWIAISAVYSFYTEHLSHYSAVYGALSAIVVVLIWLYLTAITLILGAEWNHLRPAILGENARR